MSIKTQTVSLRSTSLNCWQSKWEPKIAQKLNFHVTGDSYIGARGWIGFYLTLYRVPHPNDHFSFFTSWPTLRCCATQSLPLRAPSYPKLYVSFLRSYPVHLTQCEQRNATTTAGGFPSVAQRVRPARLSKLCTTYIILQPTTKYGGIYTVGTSSWSCGL